MDAAGARPAAYADAASLRKVILARYAVRLHIVLILGACFAAGLVITKALLMAGVHTMWIRYSVALVAGYLVFLLGVRIWLRLCGFDHPILPARRRNYVPDIDIFSGSGGGSSGSGLRVPVFRGGGGGSGGGGASANFGGVSVASGAADSPGVAMASGGGSQVHAGGSGSGFGFDFDLGDGGWVLLALIALAAVLFGGVVWLVYAAPTILADAAFAGLLSAGLVRSTRRMSGGSWIGSVVGHTWLAFALVFVFALVFAIVAQHHFPEAHSLVDVVRSL